MCNGGISIQIQGLIIVVLGICIGVVFGVMIFVDAEESTNTVRTYQKRCTLDSLATYNITVSGSCPKDQITIENYDSISQEDKQAIDFILGSNDYQLHYEDKVRVEIIDAKPTGITTNQTR